MFVPLVGVMVMGEFDATQPVCWITSSVQLPGPTLLNEYAPPEPEVVCKTLDALNQLDGPAGEAGVARAELAAVRRIVEHLAAHRRRVRTRRN